MAACAFVALSITGRPAQAEAPKPVDSPAVTPVADSSAGTFGSVDPTASRMTMRIAVRSITYEDRVVNGVTGRYPVARIVYKDEAVPLPASESEIRMLRDELAKLRQKKIDVLDVPALVRELYQEREEARADEAWKKLQRIRKELADLEREHPGTAAAGVAHTAQGSIPSEAPPAFGSVGPAYPGGFTAPLFPSGGTPTYSSAPTLAPTPDGRGLSPVPEASSFLPPTESGFNPPPEGRGPTRLPEPTPTKKP